MISFDYTKLFVIVKSMFEKNSTAGSLKAIVAK